MTSAGGAERVRAGPVAVGDEGHDAPAESIAVASRTVGDRVRGDERAGRPAGRGGIGAARQRRRSGASSRPGVQPAVAGRSVRAPAGDARLQDVAIGADDERPAIAGRPRQSPGPSCAAGTSRRGHDAPRRRAARRGATSLLEGTDRDDRRDPRRGGRRRRGRSSAHGRCRAASDAAECKRSAGEAARAASSVMIVSVTSVASRGPRCPAPSAASTLSSTKPSTRSGVEPGDAAARWTRGRATRASGRPGP